MSFTDSIGDLFGSDPGGILSGLLNGSPMASECQRKGCTAPPTKRVRLFREFRATDLCSDHAEEARSYGWVAA